MIQNLEYITGNHQALSKAIETFQDVSNCQVSVIFIQLCHDNVKKWGEHLKELPILTYEI